MTTARAGGAAGEIADDLLLDIFERLTDARDLLRCAATCKRWLRLVTARAFLRRAGLWPDTAPRPSILMGVFSQASFACTSSCFKKNYPMPCPPQFFSLQASGDGHLTFDSFFADDDVLFNFARPLASRRGLLLVRVFLPSSDCVGPSDQELHLAVCGPMGDNRTTRLLPPPAFDTVGFREHDFTGYALLTDADYGGDVGNLDRRQEHTFRVVLNYTNRDLPCACTYSSATRSWSSPIRCRSRPFSLIRCGPRAGLVIHSTVHWLYMGSDNYFYTLNVNTTTAQISRTKIPIKAHTPQLRPPPIPCIAGEGVLSFVTMEQQDHGVLELWTKQGEGNGNHDSGCEEGWQHSQLTDLGSKKINIVFFAESRGALLVKQDNFFITVDLKSKEKLLVDLKYEKMGQISGTSRDGEYCSSTSCRGGHYYLGRKCQTVPPAHVLYELDWVFNSTGTI